MSDRFFIKNENGIRALPNWLRKRRYNSWSIGHQDKNGNSMFGLSWDKKPDSYWSDWEPRGLVIMLNDDLREQTLALIEKHSR